MALRPDTTNILQDLTPHFVLARRGVAEVVISGQAYYKEEGKRSTGNDPSVMLIARSLLKPWQFLAADVTGTEAYWALGLASHSGQVQHMEHLRTLASVAGAGESELFCPRSYPLDPAVASAMRASGAPPTRLHHPCAGKHLVAIAACRHFHLPVERYWDTEHPLQKRFANLIGQLVGEKPIWLTDSCGLPTLAITARAHLQLWERLSLSEEPAYVHLKTLWTQNIRLIGGFGRLESDLMEATGGRLIAKEGADGLLALITLPAAGHPVATCLIKLASGFNSNYLALALYALLSRTPDLPSTLQTVLDYLRSRLENWVPGDQELALPPYPSPPSPPTIV